MRGIVEMLNAFCTLVFFTKVCMLLNDIQESRNHIQQLYKSMGADKVLYFVDGLNVHLAFMLGK